MKEERMDVQSEGKQLNLLDMHLISILFLLWSAFACFWLKSY